PALPRETFRGDLREIEPLHLGPLGSELRPHKPPQPMPQSRAPGRRERSLFEELQPELPFGERVQERPRTLAGREERLRRDAPRPFVAAELQKKREVPEPRREHERRPGETERVADAIARELRNVLEMSRKRSFGELRALLEEGRRPAQP